MSIRVVVADDQALFRQTLALLIGSEEDMEVVAEAADGGQGF
ncbi:MAG: DNA-binding response regulator, partial [Rhodococcus sp.]|nr:DNA-binding response regulator [Rhodococcus sp. (in: high G+C Gram-positive bacteria)]